MLNTSLQDKELLTVPSRLNVNELGNQRMLRGVAFADSLVEPNERESWCQTGGDTDAPE